MTPAQLTLIKATWANVLPIKETAADLFYGRLFDVYPEVKPYFSGDMKAQGAKLMAMINTAVNGLDDLPALVEPLKAMGARHAGYGVTDADYAKVADALLWTLEQGLGEAFTPEVKDAWVAVYTIVAETMLAGVEDPA